MSGDLFKGIKPIDFLIPFRHGIHNPTPGAMMTDNLRKRYGMPSGMDMLRMMQPPKPAAPAASPKKNDTVLL
jgi:hypothetical protein